MFGTIKARKNGQTVNLTFTDEKIFHMTYRELRRNGFETDGMWGYQIEGSVEMALTTARAACNDWL